MTEERNILKKIPGQSGFASVPNETASDNLLSWEARGLLAYLLGKPDSWEMRLSDLETKGPAREHKLRAMIANLVDNAYMLRLRCHGSDGTFYWATYVSAYRMDEATISRLSTSGSTTSGSTTCGKPPDIVRETKEKKEPTKKETEYIPINPDRWPRLAACYEFRKTWGEFQMHRRSMKKPVTELAAAKILNMCNEYPLTSAIRMLENSIMNGWQGVFPIKQQFKANNNKPPEQPEYTPEQLAEMVGRE